MTEINYIGKVVVLYPQWSKTGEPFLFKVQGGSGAEPDLIGTGVFGTFIIDGDTAKIRRRDIWRLATDDEIEQKQVDRSTLLKLLKENINEVQVLSQCYNIYSWAIDDAKNLKELKTLNNKMKLIMENEEGQIQKKELNRVSNNIAKW